MLYIVKPTSDRLKRNNIIDIILIAINSLLKHMQLEINEDKDMLTESNNNIIPTAKPSLTSICFISSKQTMPTTEPIIKQIIDDIKLLIFIIILLEW